MESMMPRKVAEILARDDRIGNSELQATVQYLREKLMDARRGDEPISFISYRTKLILETTLEMRAKSGSLQ
jgi:hypothetical protein